MASNVRRGTVPYKTTGLGEYVDEVYSLKGFFGEWAHMYRRNNPAHPLRWSDERLMYSGVDPTGLTAPDATDPRGEPLQLLAGDGTTVWLSQRSQPMPFSEKNVDSHQIRFYDRGAFTLETELGVLGTQTGDFVVIPRGLTYREAPLQSTGNRVYVFETDAPIQLAEKLWDSVGYASLFVDYSEMELPDPPSSEPVQTDGATEHEVRVRFEGGWHTLTYGFDPCRDVVGWVGDPVIFKMNVWNVPTAGTSHGHLPPPSGAVLLGEDREFFFNVLSTPPTPTVGPPHGSFGAPAHLNDYDELWLTHVFELAPHAEGHLWLLPRTIPHPGFKRPGAAPSGDGPLPRSLRINFDTRAPLKWTDTARGALFEDPIAAKYTSFFGVPLKAAPPSVRERAALDG
jgi:homogentisate 1,2-dioxygenase